MTETRKAQNNWITNESGRKQFWKQASAAGLDDSNVHELFGIASMYDYPGTLAEAIATLKQWQEQQAAASPGTAEPSPETQSDEVSPMPASVAQADDEALERLAYRCQQLPESPVLAWTKFETPRGFVWTVSVRAGLPSDLLSRAMRQIGAQIGTFEKGAGELNWLPVTDGRDVVGLPPVPSREASAPPPALQGEFPAGAPPAAPQQAGGNGKSGSDPLKKVAVDADGRAEFYVGGFRYPFKDARGPETVAGLFDPALGWTPEHFVPGAKYEGTAVAGLVVDWEKPGKYYDVVRVHR